MLQLNLRQSAIYVGSDDTSAIISNRLSFTRRMEGGDKSSLMFISIIVGFICLFYIICTVQCVRIWICRSIRSRGQDNLESPSPEAETVLVHDGRVFNLSGEQRRAVLEVIFSETSKAATEQDVGKGRRKKNSKTKNSTDVDYIGRDIGYEEDDVPHNVEIPSISSAETATSMETHPAQLHQSDIEQIDVDIEQLHSDLVAEHLRELAVKESYSTANEALYDKENSVHLDYPVKQPNSDSFDRQVPGAMNETGTPDQTSRIRDPPHQEYFDFHSSVPTPKAGCESLIKHVSAVIDETISAPPSSTKLPVHAQPRSASRMNEVTSDKQQTRLCGPPKLSLPNLYNAIIPENETVEETKEEIGLDMSHDCECDDDIIMPPIPLSKQESFKTSASEYTFDDDSTTGDNVCPICLSGYLMGDFIISSSYCTHVFHKDCILEWLTKSDDCPICRVGMVTDLEMKRGAASIVGKTRMYRAVASMQHTPSRLHRSISTSPTRRGDFPTSSSPLEGTVRRGASRSPDS